MLEEVQRAVETGSMFLDRNDMTSWEHVSDWVSERVSELVIEQIRERVTYRDSTHLEIPKERF